MGNAFWWHRNAKQMMGSACSMPIADGGAAFNKDGTLLANQYGHDVKVPGTKLRMEGRIWDLDTQQTTIDMKS